LRKKTQEEFVEDARAIHGDKYDYSFMEYVNTNTKVLLVCNKEGHGGWWVKPSKHTLRKHGCPVCAREVIGKWNLLTQEEAINNLRLVHGDTYKYPNFVYTTAIARINILCDLHGPFEMTYNGHQQGHGCKQCADIRTGLSQSKDSEQALLDILYKHEGRYSYPSFTYKGSEEKIQIDCNDHGIFWMKYGNHYNGQGCPQCKSSGYKVNKSGNLYILQYEDITKIGITNKIPASRAKQITKDGGPPFKVIHYEHFDDGSIPLALETTLLRELRKQYSHPAEKFDGSTECFLNVNHTSLFARLNELIKEFSTNAENNVQHSTAY